MNVKELIEELQKCNPDCEVATFNVNTGAIQKIEKVDGIGYIRTIFLNLVNI